MITIARPRPAALAALAAASLLTACASTDAQPGAMAPTATAPAAGPSDPGYQAVTVGAVTGGRGEVSFWTGPDVSSTEFKTALQTGLQSQGLFTAETPKYEVQAAVRLDKPMMGFTLTTSSTVNYTVRSVGDGRVVLQESITAPGSATTGDAFIGSERLRIANERSLKENIGRFVARLRTVLGGQSQP